MNPKLWDKRYQELIEYKKQQGDTNVPRRYEANPQLGVWVSNQRQYYKKFKTGISGWGMTESRINRLESIGFEWVLTGGRTSHTNVGNSSNKQIDGDGGISINTAHSSGGASNLSMKYFTSVNEWDSMYDNLVAYRRLHGNTNVPKVYDENQHLSDWLQNQKYAFQKYVNGIKCSGMTLERFQLLLEIGFALELINDETKDQSDSNSTNNIECIQSNDQEIDINIEKIDESERYHLMEILKSHLMNKHEGREQEYYIVNKKRKRIYLKDYGADREQRHQQRHREQQRKGPPRSSSNTSISHNMKLGKLSDEKEEPQNYDVNNSKTKEDKYYNSSQHQQYYCEEDYNDSIYLEAITECGSDANLDSIAAIVLKRFT